MVFGDGFALVLDTHCHALGEPIFNFMFEPTDRPIPNAYVLRESACLLHAGHGHAGAADNRIDLPPPQNFHWCQIDHDAHSLQFAWGAYEQRPLSWEEDGASGFRLAGSGLNKKVAPT